MNVLSGILIERFLKRYKALISGITDFAFLNDIHNTVEVLTEHLLVKAESAVFYSFRKLGHKNTISQFGTTAA